MDAAEGSIVVNAPVADVYERWLAFEDYPRFITAIKRVRKLDANHFVASLGFNGKQYDTTLEMMLRVPERRLAWRTLADHRAPDHFAAGVVAFTSLSDQSTCLTLKLTSSFGGAANQPGFWNSLTGDLKGASAGPPGSSPSDWNSLPDRTSHC